MPQDRTASPLAYAGTVSTLVNGDNVNRDNLYVEQTPGGTPKLTLAFLHDLIGGIVHPGSRTRVAQTPIFDQSASPIKSSYFRIIVTHAHTLAQVLDVPHGSTLTAVHGYALPGAGGSHGGLPATMPTLDVQKVDITTGSSSIIHAAVTDTSANTGAYDAAHAVAITGMSEVIDLTTYLYYVLYTAEDSTNAIDTGQYIGTTWTATV